MFFVYVSSVLFNEGEGDLPIEAVLVLPMGYHRAEFLGNDYFSIVVVKMSVAFPSQVFLWR